MASALLVGLLCQTLVWELGQGRLQTSANVAWSPRPHLYETDSQKSLYPSGGPIDILTADGCRLTERHGQVAGQGFPVWLVEYYSSGCPHCWYFAPVFRQIAEAYSGSGTIHIAACNCAEQANQDACDAMKIFRYPTLRAYKVGPEGLNLLYDVPHFEGDHQKSAKELAHWLSERSASWTPPHPEGLEKGAVFHGSGDTGNALAVDGPPRKTGWPMDFHLDDERFVEARLGLLVLLGGYSGPQQHTAAVRVASFVAQVFPRHVADFRNLAMQIQESGPVPSHEMRRMLQKWSGFFAQREHVFCADETCAVWQLLHVVAASVAAVAVTGRPLTEHGSTRTAAVSEAMDFFRMAIAEFLTCQGCRKHFLESFDGCLYGRCLVLEAADVPLQAKRMVWWLWRMHNVVSLRVLAAHPPTDSQAAVDRRWPAYRDCPGCWKAEVVNGLPNGHQEHEVDPAAAVSMQQLDAPFELDRVFGYILSQYVGHENLQFEQKIAEPLETTETRMPRFYGLAESSVTATFCVLMLISLSTLTALRTCRRPSALVLE